MFASLAMYHTEEFENFRPERVVKSWGQSNVYSIVHPPEAGASKKKKPKDKVENDAQDQRESKSKRKK